eukprot:TRINITY_DN11202_c0_g1_i1.p4 TRINITY_DN11202_c0_g1~~TRINITY_DN11202_c0_g1_i1.p4  ORF type:complete len:109 (+),score=1.19 TRINITY_DN11202_c0_g1_i1:214-540(+)
MVQMKKEYLLANCKFLEHLVFPQFQLRQDPRICVIRTTGVGGGNYRGYIYIQMGTVNTHIPAIRTSILEASANKHAYDSPQHQCLITGYLPNFFIANNFSCCQFLECY